MSDLKNASLAKFQTQARADIAKADARAADAYAVGAKANERAANAELALERERVKRLELARLTANRWLSGDELKAIPKAIEGFAGQPSEVIVFPITFESQSIANLIAFALQQGKWLVGGPELLEAPPQLPVSLQGHQAAVRIMGIFIQATGDPESQAAGEALAQALRPSGTGSWNPAPLNGAKRVLVYVGEKGNTLRTDVKE